MTDGKIETRRIACEGVKFSDHMLRFDSDSYRVDDVVFVAINTDTNPKNGVAGAIEVQTRSFDDFKGVGVKSHRYLITGNDCVSLDRLATRLGNANVTLGKTRIANKKFVQSYWGSD